MRQNDVKTKKQHAGRLFGPAPAFLSRIMVNSLFTLFFFVIQHTYLGPKQFLDYIKPSPRAVLPVPARAPYRYLIFFLKMKKKIKTTSRHGA